MTPFIVAEISKTWRGRRGEEEFKGLPPSNLLCGRFEHVIEVNRLRDYELHRFAISQVMIAPEELCETIIAVFRQVSVAADERG